MKMTLPTIGLASLLVVSMWGTLHCQEDIKTLADPAFTHPRRGPVPFNHDQHNTKAKISECKTCHHDYQDGKLVPDGDSAGTPCSQCHTLIGAKGVMPLGRAYHRQCGNCHAAKGAGPVDCAGCHPQGPKKNNP